MTKNTRAILGSCLGAMLWVGCASEVKPEATTPPATPTDTTTKPADPASPPAANVPNTNTPSNNTPTNTPPSPVTPVAAAGSGATPPATPPANNPNTPVTPPATPPVDPTKPTAIDWHGDIRGKCTGLKTKFPSDDFCIPPPPAGEGMQIHIGPSNYDDAAEVAKYLMQPGEESSQCFGVVTPNTEKIFYQTYHLSGRAGTHHIIDAMMDGGGAKPGPAACEPGAMQIGSLPGASKPYMPRLSVPPEYENVGKSIPAHARMQADMHYYNFTEKPLLREFWMNIYFVKADQITEEAKQIVLFGGTGWNSSPIQPGTDKTYSYSCPIKSDGWILSLLGHYHAHGKQFVSTITRKATGKEEKVFEMFDYMDPAQFEYNTIITNPAFSPTAAGATSGRLQVFAGDTINWSCHIINDSAVALRYVNEVKTGEMCNLWGASTGSQAISCFK